MAAHTTLAAICPACIPLWFIVIIATGVVLFPFLEGKVGNPEKWAPYIKVARPIVYSALIAGLALLSIWWNISTEEEIETQNTHCTYHTMEEEPSTCCTSAPVDLPEETSSYGFYAIGSDAENALSYCYALNTSTGKQTSFEVPHSLSTANALHFYTDDLIVIEHRNGMLEPYSVDLDSGQPSLELTLCSFNNDFFSSFSSPIKTSTEEPPESWSKHLPEDWEIIGTPLSDPQSGMLFLSIFDGEKKANLLVTLDPESNRFLTLMETDLPIHAVGSIAQ